eukprot:gene18038-24453_t
MLKAIRKHDSAEQYAAIAAHLDALQATANHTSLKLSQQAIIEESMEDGEMVQIISTHIKPYRASWSVVPP